MSQSRHVGTEDSAEGAPSMSGSRWWRGLPVAAGAYLLLSLLAWAHLWVSGPSTTTTCTCDDTSAFIWFLEWPAYAIEHGHNPLYSTLLFHPTGVNLLTNTGVLVIGTILAPVTWLFGPVVTLNLAITLAPVLSGLAMFVLLRRWVTWLPAAFVGGLLYGFCPFALQSLSEGQLHQGMLMFPPLILLMLDEILFRQRMNPIVAGIVFGVLVALQFFVGSEILVMLGLVTASCLILIAIYWWRQAARSVVQALRAVKGLATGAATAAILLCYPVWFALAGPAHLSGRIWPLPLPLYGNTVSGFVATSHPASFVFFGAALSRQFLGIGLVAVCVVGLCVWRHDLRMRLFATGAVIALILSLGQKESVVLPWQVLGNLPLLENVYPNRFIVIAYLALAVLLGLIVDHMVKSVRSRWSADGSAVDDASVGSERRWWPAASGVVVAAIALVPIALYLSPAVPFSAQPVVYPTWFRTVGTSLTGHQTVLVLPTPYFLENSLTWQALDGMRYSLASGVGPEADPTRAGAARNGQVLLNELSSPFTLPPSVSPAGITAIRRTIDLWGVTTVVIPEDGDVPAYEWRVNSVPLSVALVTLATGTAPVHQAHAWVWYNVRRAPAPIPLSSQQVAACLAPGAIDDPAIPKQTACLLGTTKASET